MFQRRQTIAVCMLTFDDSKTGSAIPRFEEESGMSDIKAESSLDERKLEYTHFAPGVEPRTPSTVGCYNAYYVLLPCSCKDLDNEVYLSLPRTEPRSKRCLQSSRVPSFHVRKTTQTERKRRIRRSSRVMCKDGRQNPEQRFADEV